MGNVKAPKDSRFEQDDSYVTWEYNDIEAWADIHSFITRAKGERYVAATLQLHASELLALAIAFNYFSLVTRKNAGSIARLVGWSGRRYKWKRKIQKEIEACIAKGAMGRARSNHGPGFTIYITKKGLEILTQYQQRTKLISEDLILKQQSAA